MLKQSEKEEFMLILCMIKKSLKEYRSKIAYDKSTTGVFAAYNKQIGKYIVETQKLLLQKNIKNLVNLFKVMYGEYYYEVQTFNNLFSDLYGLQIPGKLEFIKKPTNDKEVIEFFELLLSNVNKDKMSVLSIKINEKIYALTNLIEYYAFKLDNMELELNEISEFINGAIIDLNKDEFIDINSYNDIKIKLNNHVYLENPTEETKHVGDYIVNFSRKYNLEKLPQIKSDEYNNEVLKYYFNIVKTKINELNYDAFPSYEDPNFVSYMSDIFSMLEENIVNDKNNCKRLALTTIHHRNYYNKKA